MRKSRSRLLPRSMRPFLPTIFPRRHIEIRASSSSSRARETEQAVASFAESGRARPVTRLIRSGAVVWIAGCATLTWAGGSATPPLALPGVSATVPAFPAEQGPRWSALTPGQQAALRPLAADWPSINADHKSKWLELVSQWPKLSHNEQQRIQERMAHWSTLTPQQRGAARAQYKQAQELAPVDRQARWEAYQALPEDERKALAARAAAASSAPVAKRQQAPRSRDDSDDGRLSRVQSKSNVVALPESGQPVRPVTPSMIQAPTGATTTLISKRADPPPHQQTGLPKISGTPAFVNPSTLLPQRGPQGAAVIAPAASVPLVRP